MLYAQMQGYCSSPEQFKELSPLASCDARTFLFNHIFLAYDEPRTPRQQILASSQVRVVHAGQCFATLGSRPKTQL